MFGKSQEIADLQAALTVAIGERDSLATAALTHEATITALTAERDDAVARIRVAQDAAAAAQAAADARVSEFEAAMQARIDAEVINRLAAAGTDPIHRDPDASDNGKTLTRAEFNKLKPAARNQFIREGGKLTE